ncbi:hypothetical protein [Wocania ichthyoenteri]|uniref:hypothetical protein n=1 Tax=Wocania ichthyoenteri TaxID=1230531 RepID=UPI00068993DC|nr:hypothetical protein [Wocania ichthyoenteri]
MNFKNLIYVSAISLLLLNCSGDSDEVTPPTPTPATITYNNTVKNIMSGNCTSCHGTPTTNGAPVSFTTFSQVKTDVDKIITRINSTTNPMPPSGLMGQSNRDLIQKWKDDGLLEN